MCATLILLSIKRIWYKVFIKVQLFVFFVFNFLFFVLLYSTLCLRGGFVVVVMFLLKWSELSSSVPEMMCLVVISPVKINPSLGQPAEKIAFPSHGFVLLWQQLPEFPWTAQAAVRGTLLPNTTSVLFYSCNETSDIIPCNKVAFKISSCSLWSQSLRTYWALYDLRFLNKWCL